MDWAGLFEFRVPALELIVRGTLMYWLLFLIFRFVLRRDAGALGLADLLFVVIIADAAQNAMSGPYETVAEGAVLVATLAAWNYALDWASFHYEAVRRFTQPPPLPLISNGRILARNLRQELMTRADLEAQLREHGIARVADVRRAFIESDGRLSVIAYEDKQPDARPADGGGGDPPR
jgi:uncharacterized membrane protein YcaP (DUF421 family)